MRFVLEQVVEKVTVEADSEGYYWVMMADPRHPNYRNKTGEPSSGVVMQVPAWHIHLFSVGKEVRVVVEA